MNKAARIADEESVVFCGNFSSGKLFLFSKKTKSKSFILSVDIPSGLNPDTGEIDDKAIKADTTITFHRIKQGLVKNVEQCGKILPVKIGIPIEAELGVL